MTKLTAQLSRSSLRAFRRWQGPNDEAASSRRRRGPGAPAAWSLVVDELYPVRPFRTALNTVQTRSESTTANAGGPT